MADFDNKTTIHELFAKKNHSFGMLHRIMEEKAKNKDCLSNEQMESFQRFFVQYKTKKRGIISSIETLNQIDLNEMQKQMLHNDTDFEYVYDKFLRFSKSQTELINCLNDIIEGVDETIKTLR